MVPRKDLEKLLKEIKKKARLDAKRGKISPEIPGLLNDMERKVLEGHDPYNWPIVTISAGEINEKNVETVKNFGKELRKVTEIKQTINDLNEAIGVIRKAPIEERGGSVDSLVNILKEEIQLIENPQSRKELEMELLGPVIRFAGEEKNRIRRELKQREGSSTRQQQPAVSKKKQQTTATPPIDFGPQQPQSIKLISPVTKDQQTLIDIMAKNPIIRRELAGYYGVKPETKEVAKLLETAEHLAKPRETQLSKGTSRLFRDLRRMRKGK